MPCASNSPHQPGLRRSPAPCADLYVNLAEPLLNWNVSRLKGTAMSEDRICMARDGGLAHVELAREDKLNALDGGMFAAIREGFRTLGADSSVRLHLPSARGR